MKRVFYTLFLLALILSACAPAMPILTQPAVTSAITQPAGTSIGSATATNKPKVKKATVAADSLDTGNANNPQDKRSAQTPTQTNPDFIAGEILGRPTGTSVTVNVIPAVAMNIYVEYGTAPGIYTSRTSLQPAPGGQPVETLIDGLLPNTRYYYRLHYGEKSGPEHSFMTQRASGSSFTFDLQGDSHPERLGKQFNADLYARTLQSAAKDDPDFYFTIGDDFSVDQLKTVTAETVRQLYLNQRQWLGQVSAPVFLVNGNHEQASRANLDGTPSNVAVWAQTARNACFPQPAPDEFYTGDADPVDLIGLLRDYYAFTWGDALFVVIDPYWHSPVAVDNAFGAGHSSKAQRDLWQVTLGDAQYQWFKKTLETSTSKYKFVFTHHVLGTGRGGVELAGSYEWGDAAHLAAHRPGWDQTIQQVMAANHVTIFFQGHDHLFARQELDGVLYQTLPEPANPNDTLENDSAYLSGDKLPNSGHLRVTISPAGVTVDYIRSYLDRPDEVAFSYTVSK